MNRYCLGVTKWNGLLLFRDDLISANDAFLKCVIQNDDGFVVVFTRSPQKWYCFCTRMRRAFLVIIYGGPVTADGKEISTVSIVTFLWQQNPSCC